MIIASNIEKSFGPQVLFEDVSFLINKGERVGLVGKNGTGKSTLFKMILGKESIDSGSLTFPKGYRIGALEQHIHFTKPTVLSECIEALPPEKQWDHYKAEIILSGLGFSEQDFQKDPTSFSGGYQVRINLCKALLSDPNMLLLDEPTNYLDILSLRWLKEYLIKWPGEMVLITHDRDFMDKVSTHTLGIHRKQAKKVKGDTIKFYELIIQEEETYELTRKNIENKRKEMQLLVDRFRAKASKATMAQSRLKMMNKMGTMDKLETEKNLGFRFNHLACPGKTIMNVEKLSFSYDGKNNIFSDISFSIGKNDRIAIIGANGKGKSTLLNSLAGELVPTEGKIIQHPSACLGHFGQTNIERLDPQNKVIDEILRSNPSLSLQAAHSICGAMMFDGDMSKKKVNVLSGGERSRVLLGKIISHPTNLLLLDEPTHHLDVESIETLIEELNEYKGALIIVTHSELLLKALAKNLIIFHRGQAEFFRGGYDEFLEKIGWEGQPVSEKKVKTKINKKDARKQRALERQKAQASQD
ncbi:MAG: ABC-F family ATP-binding cassette domain-containing protein [Nitrospinaceae bacterium]|nr:ABC-F family ATP-binding cassette domain-containing protein [Nitrospina sp.]MBT5867830.1 ABC-F family ATP-binding cassette domain-containing protein [Nitrospinaceae bacterium]MBT6345981.1 ABC-F family ATP-binding cassette domain-containing protein [Nitrospina sp.]